MKENFEKNFWVPLSDSEDSIHVINRSLVNRRGIYKDVLRPTHAFTEY